jgi:Winged helix DNA-binding domain
VPAPVTPVRTIDDTERRARLGRRHALAPGAAAPDVVALTEAIVVLHATDAGSVFLAARARVDGLVPADVERALYDDRALVRMLGMRRTVFVVPVDLVPVVHAACTRAVAIRERRRLVGQIEGAGVAEDGAAWLDEVEDETIAALVARGEATSKELRAAVGRLGVTIPLAVGKAYEGTLGMSTAVLQALAAAGRVVRGRPLGSWMGNQYRWAPAEAWLGPAHRDVDEMGTAEAQAELARRWLAAFGPATVADLRWWAGWTAREARAALEAVGAVPVALEGVAGGTGIVLPGDEAPEPAVDPWVALLPALDPTIMGWKERDWYLGDHAGVLFDRSGNPGPTVWADGRVVGGWAQRPDGEVVVRLLEDVGADVTAAAATEAERVSAWLGDRRVTPRFRTPLERELVS